MKEKSVFGIYRGFGTYGINLDYVPEFVSDFAVVELNRNIKAAVDSIFFSGADNSGIDKKLLKPQFDAFTAKIVSPTGYHVIGTFETQEKADAHIKAYKPLFEEEMLKRGDIDISTVKYVVDRIPHRTEDVVIFLQQEALSRVLPTKELNSLVFDNLTPEEKNAEILIFDNVFYPDQVERIEKMGGKIVCLISRQQNLRKLKNGDAIKLKNQDNFKVYTKTNHYSEDGLTHYADVIDMESGVSEEVMFTAEDIEAIDFIDIPNIYKQINPSNYKIVYIEDLINNQKPILAE